MCTTHMAGTLGDQKRMLDPLNLGLQIAVNHNVVAATETRFLVKETLNY